MCVYSASQGSRPMFSDFLLEEAGSLASRSAVEAMPGAAWQRWLAASVTLTKAFGSIN